MGHFKGCQANLFVILVLTTRPVMWVTPKTTLGGAGMWEEVRTNGVIVLQHYKPEGTVLGGTKGFFTRSSDAMNGI